MSCSSKLLTSHILHRCYFVFCRSSLNEYDDDDDDDVDGFEHM